MYTGTSQRAAQNSHILEFFFASRFGSFRTWTVVSSACIRSCDSSSAFILSCTLASQRACTFIIQFAMSWRDIVAWHDDLMSDSMR